MSDVQEVAVLFVHNTSAQKKQIEPSTETVKSTAEELRWQIAILTKELGALENGQTST